MSVCVYSVCVLLSVGGGLAAGWYPVRGVRMKCIQNKNLLSQKLIFIHLSGLCHRKGKLNFFSSTAYVHSPGHYLRRAQ